jgi:hypothetical protein
VRGGGQRQQLLCVALEALGDGFRFPMQFLAVAFDSLLDKTLIQLLPSSLLAAPAP